MNRDELLLYFSRTYTPLCALNAKQQWEQMKDKKRRFS